MWMGRCVTFHAARCWPTTGRKEYPIMTLEEIDEAEDVRKSFENIIIASGKTLFRPLNREQIEYIVDSMNEQFRFWSVVDGSPDSH